MANPLANGDILECRIYVWQVDQIAINVLHFIVEDLSGVVTLEEAVDQPPLHYHTHYKDCMTVESWFVGADMRRILPTETITVQTTSGEGSGSAVAPSLPRQVSGILTKRTNSTGRRGRGRAYIPFPGETHSGDDGLPSPGYITFLQVLADDMVDRLTVPGEIPGDECTLQPAVWSRLAQTAFPITEFTVRPRFATQRSRGAYGRHNTLPFGGP